MPKFYICIIAVLLLCLAGAVKAQESESVPSQVMVLGTYHFANPGLDVVKTDVADVLTPEKQGEIMELIDLLADFRPTKIAVEMRHDQAPRLDSLYSAYRAGTHTLSRNEVQQLGFRLAEQFDHSRLYPIDHEGEFPFGAVMEYAQAHDLDFVEDVQRTLQKITEEQNRWQKEKSIIEILRLMNDPEHIDWGHARYMDFARVGAGDTFVGADLLSKWYERNIRIFSSLQAIAEPDDRILVIIGAGHLAILRELVESDSRLVLIEPLDYI